MPIGINLNKWVQLDYADRHIHVDAFLCLSLLLSCKLIDNEGCLLGHTIGSYLKCKK